jgi:hypothetical protein
MAHCRDTAGERMVVRSPSDVLPTAILANSHAHLPPLLRIRHIHPRRLEPSQPPVLPAPHDIFRSHFLHFPQSRRQLLCILVVSAIHLVRKVEKTFGRRDAVRPRVVVAYCARSRVLDRLGFP